MLRRRPLVVCDAAHNASGARVLAKTLRSIDLKCDVMVFGVLRDKDYRKMLRVLSRVTGKIILTKPDSKRALPLARLKEAARELGLKFQAAASVPRALHLAREECGRGGTLLICSHAMYYISAFCRRALWLRDGLIEELGPTQQVVPRYEAFLDAKSAAIVEAPEVVPQRDRCGTPT